MSAMLAFAMHLWCAGWWLAIRRLREADADPTPVMRLVEIPGGKPPGMSGAGGRRRCAR